MALDAEVIIDRRRLRRKLTFWRVLTFGVLILTVAGLGLWASGTPTAIGLARQHVARISVSGVIAGDQRTTDLLRRVGESSAVAGVVVSISSPGGTTSGSEELFQGLRRLASRKPTVAFVDGVAASGGYITALGADRIVARETALVGSIGVLFQYPEVTTLLSRIGVEVQEIKSSPLKAEPSPFHPASGEARAALQAVVNDTYTWFKDLVRSRRGLSEAELAAVSDGRVFNARQGLPLKLVDQLGTERDAIAWLEREKGVARDLPVRDWRPTGSSRFASWTAAASVAEFLGLDGVASLVRAVAEPADAARSGGLMVIWRPGPLDR